MSKISLSPDSNGTGIFTIASPNSNTNRTLTLPDDTGTIVTNSGNQAGSFTTLNTSGAVVFNDAGADVDFRVESDTVDHALFVEGSSGNVGIGTSSPVERLTVSNTGTSDLISAYRTNASGLSGVTFALNNASSSKVNYSAIYGGVSSSTAGSESGLIAFYTINSGSNAERMRITSAGEVLVGGTTEISSASGALTLERAFGGILNLYRNDTSITADNIMGALRFYGNDTTSNTPTSLAYIQATASGTHAAGDNPTDLVFGCTNDGSETAAEFARLGQGGTAGRYFQVSQPTIVNQQDAALVAAGGTAGSINRISVIGVYKHVGITNACAYLRLTAEDGVANYLWADNSDVLRISTNADHIGTTSGTVVGTQTSDERIKDISGPVTYGLSEVLSLEPIAFTMKDDPSIPKIGFSAQQVQPIVPEAVYDTKECIDGYTENEETKEQIANSDRTKLAMEYTQLIPVLVNAVKELKAITDTQAQTISALEARIAALETGV